MDSADLDAMTLDAIVKFTEELERSPRISIDAYLANNRLDSDELRPYFETLVKVRNCLAHVRLSDEESASIFARVRNRVANAGKATASAILDRRPDVMILLLHFMRELVGLDVWGDTKLVKLLFLLGKEAGCDQLVPDFYGHYAYSFGAFDDAVPQDAEMLAAKKIISMAPPEARFTFASGDLGIPNEKQVNNVYRLTPRGQQFANRLVADAVAKNPEIVERLKKVILAHGKKSTDELLRYTYTKYPDTAKNSKVRDKYLKPDDNGPDKH